MGKEESSGLEWRINVLGGTSKALVPKRGLCLKMWLSLNGLVIGFFYRIQNFIVKAWNIGVADPRKVMHCLKLGLALTFVSLFYYMRPLYDGVGGNAIWAIMTVVVVFEYTVGATLSKSINRAIATFLAGSLGLGVHWIANKSGPKFEPVILGFFVFILASATTFTRFIPSVKARFDYGALIFILTFSLVSVSGYRVDKLFELAHERLSTIAIGTSLCVLVSMLVYPVWAGLELHCLMYRNLEKLAESLDVCVTEYFKEAGDPTKEEEDHNKKLQGYKCVLTSKATEDLMANLARWEPRHGRFSFRHPWKQYLKVGASMRSCAYCIETLTGCVDFGVKTSDLQCNQLGEACVKLGSASSNVLRELSSTVKSMTKSPNLDFLVGEMNFAIQELQRATKTFPQQLTHSSIPQTVEASENSISENINGTENTPIMQVLPLATLATLVIEIAARVERIVDTVDELSTLAEFKLAAAGEEKASSHEAGMVERVMEKKSGVAETEALIGWRDGLLAIGTLGFLTHHSPAAGNTTNPSFSIGSTNSVFDTKESVGDEDYLEDENPLVYFTVYNHHDIEEVELEMNELKETLYVDDLIEVKSDRATLPDLIKADKAEAVAASEKNGSKRVSVLTERTKKDKQQKKLPISFPRKLVKKLIPAHDAQPINKINHIMKRKIHPEILRQKSASAMVSINEIKANEGVALLPSGSTSFSKTPWDSMSY